MVDNGENELPLDLNDPYSIKRFLQREVFLQTKDLQKVKEFLGMNAQLKVLKTGSAGGEEIEEEDKNIMGANANIAEWVKKKIQRGQEKAVEAANQASKMRLDYLTQESKNQNDFMKEIRISLSSLNQRVEQKASNANVRNLEQQFAEYAKLRMVQIVQEEIDTKANIEDLKLFRQEYQTHLNEFADLKKRFSSTVDVQHKLQNNTQEFSVQMESRFALIGDEIKRNEFEIMNKLNQLKENFVNYQKYIDVRFIEDMNKIQQRVTYEELDAVKLEMQKYATLNGLRELEKKVVPVVNAMCDRVNDYGTSNDQMREMIRRFDEVLSDKASKTSLTSLEYEIEQAYVKKKYWERLQEEINATLRQQQATMKLMQESVKNFEINMADEVESSVKKGLAKYMANYEKVLNQFNKFFDQEELSKIIDRKADVTLVQNVQDIKANRVDVDSCLKLIESINERMKHLSILQVEIARSLLPQKTPNTYNTEEAFNHKYNRREFLLKQAQLTAQWVVDNPLKIAELHNQIISMDVDLLPQEGETTNYLESNIAQPAGEGKTSSNALNLNDPVPVPVKQFERFYQITQEHLKPPEAPQTIKKWKNQLTQRLQMSQSTNQPLMLHRQTKSINPSTASNQQPTTVVYLESQGKSVKHSQNHFMNHRKNSDASNTFSNNQQRTVTRGGASTYAGGQSPKDLTTSLQQQSYADLLNMQKEHFLSILKANKHDFTGPASGILVENNNRNDSPLIEKRFTNEICVDEDLIAQSFFQNFGPNFYPERNIHTAAAANFGYRTQKTTQYDDSSTKKVSPLSLLRGNQNMTSAGNTTVQQSKVMLHRYNGSLQSMTPGVTGSQVPNNQGGPSYEINELKPFDAQVIINDGSSKQQLVKKSLKQQHPSVGINSAGFDVKLNQVVIDSPFDESRMRSINQLIDQSQSLEHTGASLSKRFQNIQKPGTANPNNRRGPVRKLRSSLN